MDKEILLSSFKKSIGEPDATTGMYGDTGISSRTLDVYIDNLLPRITDDNTVDDAFIGAHVGFIKAIGGQMRHEQSEYVKNYKPKEQEHPGANDEWQKRIEALEKERDQERLNNQINGLRSAVLGKCKELKVSNENLWKDSVGLVPHEDGMTTEKMLEKTKAIYEAKQKDYFGDGAVPYGGEPKGGGSQVSSEEANAKREAFRQKMIAQGRLPEVEK